MAIAYQYLSSNVLSENSLFSRSVFSINSLNSQKISILIFILFTFCNIGLLENTSWHKIMLLLVL
ncbi:hypothetical protein AFSV47Ss_0039 [African swine fever virus]|uniref:Uncharacterized protein n=1 Tax=African swine fever virus TaxID=10497 RepID=A0A6G6AHF7_ASF|nr:hypothetical protein AFSV47Ss_0039 [African swine fever virus]